MATKGFLGLNTRKGKSVDGGNPQVAAAKEDISPFCFHESKQHSSFSHES